MRGPCESPACWTLQIPLENPESVTGGSVDSATIPPSMSRWDDAVMRRPEEKCSTCAGGRSRNASASTSTPSYRSWSQSRAPGKARLSASVAASVIRSASS